MILVDTSAWIEFLRDTGTPVCDEVDRLLATAMTIGDAVPMEVLASARGETVGKLIDCLIVAVRHGAAILHADPDFDALGRHAAVEIHQFGTRR